MLSFSPRRVFGSKISPRPRWRWTRRLSRIGVVGATVMGVAVAFQIGGPYGNALLLAWSLGLPFSFPLAWLPAFGLNVQGTAVASWGWSHLALAASTVLSWASFGVVIDVIRHYAGSRRPPAAPPAMPHPTDPYLAAAHAELEALLRQPRTPVRDPDAPNAFRRVLSRVALQLTIGLRKRAARAIA